MTGGREQSRRNGVRLLFKDRCEEKREGGDGAESYSYPRLYGGGFRAWQH